MASQPHEWIFAGRVSLLQPSKWVGGLERLLYGVWILSTALQTLEPCLGRQEAERKHVHVRGLHLFLFLVLLPAGVPAQEKAPAKLLVYLQRFRPLDYQRLLEADSSSKATGLLAS